MKRFGISAYMKVLGLKKKPQITAIKKKLEPSSGGYDFHRQMRTIASRHILENTTGTQIAAEIKLISSISERKYAIAALKKLIEWRSKQKGHFSNLGKRTVNSPNDVFQVELKPDFVLNTAGKQVGFHIWNTASPKLTSREALGAMGLFKDAFQELDILAIICLKTGIIYEYGFDEKPYQLAVLLARDIERIFENTIKGEDKIEERSEDRPMIQ